MSLSNNYKPLIVAHRGESFDAPENTLEAINLAWQRGDKAVEIDIQLTADNKIVVIHDYDTQRVSGNKKVISSSTLHQIQSVNAGFFKDNFKGKAQIPTLQEVLLTIPVSGKIIIEIKSDNRIVPVLKHELIKSKLLDEQIEIIAFNIKVLALAKKMMPQYKMLWLLSLDYALPWWILPVRTSNIIRKVNKFNLDGVNVWAGKLLTRKFIAKFANVGLSVYTWTVNDVETANKLVSYGVDAITTDRAQWLSNNIFNSNK